ncbi:hypothetical protein NEHOM01_1009 [Nematocida homosporus]|uniref:uncharacterized protein n=1 Tax=Nematocida homosporus TaxID=1912981 RepID=UPI00221EBAA2|nr:uncharacterized protein NEHOM01_1009 [Nematocida homosporus]KAI5185717.1 hypothetical protein NEHOM01_1009 [Nematocida homosporus]
MRPEMKEALDMLLREKVPKGSVLKKEAEEAMAAIMNYQMEEEKFPEYVHNHHQIGMPFIRALQELGVKNRSFLPCLAVIHKMITWSAISSEFIPHILEGFEKNIENYPEVRLRVLQMLLPLVQNPVLVRGRNLMHLFKIGILLVETSRNQLISTTKVIIFHLVANVFERPSILQGQAREIAVQDCKEILEIAIDCAKKNNLFGFELLYTCVSDGAAGFQQKALADMVGLMVDFLVPKLEQTRLQIVSVSLQLFLQIIKNIVSDDGEIVSLLLSVLRAKVPSGLIVLREEFVYKLPTRVAFLSLSSSAELADIMFAPSQTIDVTSITPINMFYLDQMARTEIPEDSKHMVSLAFFHIVRAATAISQCSDKKDEQTQIISLFIPYFIRFLQKLVELPQIKEEEVVAIELKKSLAILIQMATQKSLTVMNTLLLEGYQMAQKNPAVFYSLLANLTDEHKEKVTVWPAFFLLTATVQKTHPELGSWEELMGLLTAFQDVDLQRAIEGAGKSEALAPEKYADLFLSLAGRGDCLKKEFTILIEHVFQNQQMLDNIDSSVALIASFFSAYFSEKRSATMHKIVLSHIMHVFMADYNNEHAHPIRQEVLNSLSIGVRSSGETLYQAWTCIYDILIASMQSPLLSGMVFDIIQVVTDRLLYALPEETLVTTVQILGICCLTKKDNNISFRALQCIRELTEFVLTKKITAKVRKDVWHAVMCLLCSVIYDGRDDVRDSAIVQLFESIYLCKKHGHLEWAPLVQVFLRRVLGAAVYTKDREIYTGEYEDPTSEEAEETELNNDQCPCQNLGACAIESYETAEKESYQRSLESTKGILLAISALVFENFSELKKASGFYPLWVLFTKILVRFSRDPEMEVTVIYALRNGIPCINDPIYKKHFFLTVCDICTLSVQPSSPLEALMQMLKITYRAIDKSATPEDKKAYFLGITSLLAQNCPNTGQTLTFLEYEAISALDETGSSCTATVRVDTQLKWLRLFIVSTPKLSSYFAMHIMNALSKELIGSPLAQTIHRKAISVLIMFQSQKRTVPTCWAEAKKTLQAIFQIEAKPNAETQLVWASREILGLPNNQPNQPNQTNQTPTQPNQTPTQPNQTPTRNRNILRALSDNHNYTKAIREEETEMCEYIGFLENISLTISKSYLLDLYRLLVETWFHALDNQLFALYLTITRTLCTLIHARKDLSKESIQWLQTILSQYNIQIRTKRTAYSRFQREAITYILQEIKHQRLGSLSIQPLLKELVLCASSDDTTISAISLDILHDALSRPAKHTH